MKDRILQFIDYKNISKLKFYKKCGISNGYLENVVSIGNKIIEKILFAYPELNPTWLYSGQGQMIHNDLTDYIIKESEEKYLYDYKELYLKECYITKLQKDRIKELEEKLGAK